MTAQSEISGGGPAARPPAAPTGPFPLYGAEVLRHRGGVGAPGPVSPGCADTSRAIEHDDQGPVSRPGRRAGWPGPRVTTPPGGGGTARATAHTPPHRRPGSPCRRETPQPRATRHLQIAAELAAVAITGALLGALLAAALTAAYVAGWLTPTDPSADTPRATTEETAP